MMMCFYSLHVDGVPRCDDVYCDVDVLNIHDADEDLLMTI